MTFFEQRCLNSYRQRPIRQTDCEISSYYGKKLNCIKAKENLRCKNLHSFPREREHCFITGLLDLLERIFLKLELAEPMNSCLLCKENYFVPIHTKLSDKCGSRSGVLVNTELQIEWSRALA